MRKLQLIGASVIAAAGLLVGLQAHALAISPATNPQCTTDDNGNQAPGYIIGCPNFIPIVTTEEAALLEKQYLNNVGDPIEEGWFAASYDTAYGPDPLDPANAAISWVPETPFLNCTSLRCFLFVKDGVSHIPASYAFEITGWNGMESIVLTGFWPEGGAISHVEIWSGSQAVPEPSMLALFGLGLLGLGLVRRRTMAR